MTDVLILHRIPGGTPGQIVPLDERMKNHVAAGNAKILPNANPAFGTQPPAAVAPSVLSLNGSAREPEAELEDDTDEDTED